MARRSSRSDAFIDRPKLLEATGACRQVLIGEQAKMKPGGPLYHSASAVIAAIDGLAMLLTGKRDYFWAPLRESRSDDCSGEREQISPGKK